MIPGAPQTVELYKNHIEAKLAGLLCPDHNQPPRLIVKGESLKDATVSLSACCSKLIDRANKAIAHPSRDQSGTK